ncbi:Ribosome maturation protein Sdo1/SBDS-like protein [Aduncisulcus paluster]|uniref:Ribosome maturation protein Sdo1/SBDS-like protein n=1 Tax=Aduncisulcus paluster TaxID=2918883 RepID=A0ABQ5JY06_9EUKA|nr:Ribosome maturation protein Sdo1/SBDS-like protein [Aduncisulcus paluster]
MQVSEEERKAELEAKYRDIAVTVSKMTLNPQFDGMDIPYPVDVILRTMKNQLHYSVHPKKSTKVQALTVIRQLKRIIPIKRIRVSILLICPVTLKSSLGQSIDNTKKIKSFLSKYSISDFEIKESKQIGNKYSLRIDIDSIHARSFVKFGHTIDNCILKIIKGDNIQEGEIRVW